jgi:hypothetical protein
LPFLNAVRLEKTLAFPAAVELARRAQTNLPSTGANLLTAPPAYRPSAAAKGQAHSPRKHAQ